MLRTREYQLLSEMALRSPDGCFVEVGAGYGTSTIVLANAMRRKTRPSQVVTFERGLASSNTPGRAHDDTLGILRANLRKFGVEGGVSVQQLDLSLTADCRRETTARLVEPVALLFLDAGGEVYRDFYLFYDLMLPGGIVVIDDYALESEIEDAATARVQQKFIKTRRYVDAFISRGLIETSSISKRTFFGRKPSQGPAGSGLSLEEGNALQRSIEAEIVELKNFGSRRPGA